MNDLKPVDVVIGIPYYDHIKQDCLISLLSLMEHSFKAGLTMQRFWTRSSMLVRTRQKIVEAAIESKAKYLLFIDSDMVFPPDGLTRLIHHDVDIASGLYFSKQAPYTPIAGLRQKDGHYERLKNWERDRLVEVDAVGCGFLLIKRQVLEKIQWPHFSVLIDVKNRELHSEDYYFCHKAKLEGFHIMIDPTLELKHIGDYEYGEKDFLKFQKLLEMYEAEKAQRELERLRGTSIKSPIVPIVGSGRCN